MVNAQPTSVLGGRALREGSIKFSESGETNFKLFSAFQSDSASFKQIKSDPRAS